MLVLSRMKDESIVIGGQIEVTVLGVHGSKVRLGVTAPKSVSVHRGEIQLIIDRETKRKESEHGAKSHMPSSSH